MLYFEEDWGIKQKTLENLSINKGFVPGVGLEPTRPKGHKILSLACLPIPPSRRATIG